MKGKCEVCGSENMVDVLYVCACDKNSPHVTICQKCKEKYIRLGPFSHKLPSIPIGWSYAKYLKYILQNVGEK